MEGKQNWVYFLNGNNVLLCQQIKLNITDIYVVDRSMNILLEKNSCTECTERKYCVLNKYLDKQIKLYSLKWAG